jgi:hypothetical protein
LSAVSARHGSTLILDNRHPMGLDLGQQVIVDRNDTTIFIRTAQKWQ